MAWPCISRVCCLARFWSQLDKSDLSVPLTIHNYSDIEEQEDGPPQRGGPPPRGSARPPAPARRPRDPAAGKPSGRRKSRAAAAEEPFAAETQYRRDFRAWPLPRRDDFPGQEYRPWTGAKPSKPIKSKQGFIIPEDHFVQETSYKADFKIPEVKTRFSPNPSAVFQAPSRILNV
ncbi:hypothetical protein DUI87_21505 [Hirundo rustica rustica]|uniref:MAP6 domain-containing protein 1 n=1 Tax=Hirundo rustica rustica TaxID=333673 RepID=A0A3M0K5I1_HIRRU|nr:hypothetical protein DUI87_21505 [Hirundo rustica rustica]